MGGPSMKIAMLLPDNRDEFRRYHDPVPYFGPAPTALLEGLDGMDGCEVHVVSCVQRPLAAPPKIGERTFYHALSVGKWGWLRGAYVGCIRAIRAKLRRLDPDLVHGQGTERYCGLGAAFSSFPNVITIHGNMRAVARAHRARPFSFYWLTARMEGWTLSRTGGVICNSQYTYRQVQAKARRTWCVPNALQSCFFEARTRPIDPGRPPLLLNIGTITAHKGQVELLAMAEDLFRQGLRFKLLFLGVADEKSAYAREFFGRLEQARHGGWATYHGPLAPKELVAQLDEAHALVHTPTEESFGLVVAEALARDVRVFGFSTGGVPDVVGQVDGARLVPTGDWPALGQALASWLRAGCPAAPPSSSQMKARFDPKVVAGRHLEIYRQQLQGWARRGR